MTCLQLSSKGLLTRKIVVPTPEGEELTIWDSKESEFSLGLEYTQTMRSVSTRVRSSTHNDRFLVHQTQSTISTGQRLRITSLSSPSALRIG